MGEPGCGVSPLAYFLHLLTWLAGQPGEVIRTTVVVKFWGTYQIQSVAYAGNALQAFLTACVTGWHLVVGGLT